MIPYRLIRKKRKTLSIKVSPDGSVTVSAPSFCPASEIDAFVRKNTPWIEKKQSEMLSYKPKMLSFTENEPIPLFGKTYPLRLSDNAQSVCKDGFIYLPAAAPQAGLKNLYRRELKRILPPILEAFSRRMGVQPTGLKITSARTRWGSCSGKNALSFSFFLAMCDLSAIEYVAVHELCHILHKNHSHAFWAAVGQYYPNYKQTRKYLRENAHFMRII